MSKISGFENRIDTKILHLPMDDDLINKWLISHNKAHNFHPYDIKKNGTTKFIKPIIANQCQSFENASILIFL